MPIYEYQRVNSGDDCECEHCRDGFEAFQRIADKPLVRCPECCTAVQRVFSGFSTGDHYERAMTPKTLGERGFTQYKKAGDGFYEKTCGDGPDLIRK